MPEGSRILFASDGHVARITINRPERLNAFDPDTHIEFSAASTASRPTTSCGWRSSPVSASAHSAPGAT